MAAPPTESKRSINVADLSPSESYKLGSGLIVPRPIGWIGTIDESGRHNLAPYSFFNVVATHPPTFAVAPVTTGGKKDTLRNIEATKVFTVNIVTEETVAAMNATAASLPPGADEFAHAGLTAVTTDTCAAPLVAEAVANFECEMTHMIPVGAPTGDLPGSGVLILGEARRVHIAERLVDDQLHIDHHQLRAVGRLAGSFYSTTSDSLFEIERPN